jgi:hypothetical protein
LYTFALGKVTMRTKAHNFTFNYAPRDVHKRNAELVTIYLEYTHGSARKRMSTMVKVPKGAWSVKKRVLDLKNYPYLDESQERLDEIKSKTYSQVKLLNNKKTTIETAFDEILQRMPDESILEFYDAWFKEVKGVRFSTYKQRRGIITAVQNKMVKLGYKQYSTLKFEHLADDSSLRKIASIIKSKEFGLERNGSYNYLKKLDEIYKKKYRKSSPFKDANLYGSTDKADKTGVEFVNLIIGIHKIKTLQDLESYLFYLYSLCLRGLNGKDIFMMRDEDFEGADDTHYTLNETILGDKTHLDKQYYKKRRGKSENRMQILSNLYPTLHIKKWLKWVLEIERPHLVSKPNEAYSLFRKFSDEDVYKYWSKGLRNRYTDNLKELIGKGVNSARHTYSQNGKELNIPTSKLQASIGQVPNDRKGKSIESYVFDRVEELDLVHVDVLDNIEIIEIYYQLIEALKDKKPFRGKRKTFFPSWFMKENQDLELRKLEGLAIKGWSYADEYELKRLEKKHQGLEFAEGLKRGLIKIESGANGEVTYKQTLDKEIVEPSKRLLELRLKKIKLQVNKHTKEMKQIEEKRDSLNQRS